MPLIKIFFIIFFSTIGLSCIADEKKKIIEELNNIKSLEFNFIQSINNKTEKGRCLLEFPGKLKCYYSDKKEKEIVINKKKLAVTQKRYNKTYFYPVSKSPFMNILYKDKLVEIIKTGKLEKSEKKIKLFYYGENELIVYFDSKTSDLKGWKIKDQYNNEIFFDLEIVNKNNFIKKEIFKIPNIN